MGGGGSKSTPKKQLQDVSISSSPAIGNDKGKSVDDSKKRAQPDVKAKPQPSPTTLSPGYSSAERTSGDESSEYMSQFLEAFKGSPADGWMQLKGGDTVSVLRNKSSKVPFATTCVRCEFQCQATAADAQKHFLELSTRSERDYFFKEGRVTGGNDSKKLLQAVMRTLGPEEQVVSMHQLANKDEKGNHWIIEIPVGIESTNGRLLPSNPDCFFFPSYWIQRLDAGTCMVVAMYRFDSARACPQKHDLSDTEEAAYLQDQFNQYAEPLARSLLTIGRKSQPSPEPTPIPIRAEPLQQPEKRPIPQPAVYSPSAASDGGEGQLIVGGRFKWKKGELIGRGSIGKVYMGLDFETGEMMAVKQVDLGVNLGPQQAEELKSMDQEIEIFRRISHPNIVRYYGMEKDANQLSIFCKMPFH